MCLILTPKYFAPRYHSHHSLSSFPCPWIPWTCRSSCPGDSSSHDLFGMVICVEKWPPIYRGSKGHGLNNLLKNYFTNFHIKVQWLGNSMRVQKGGLEVNFCMGEKSPAMFLNPFKPSQSRGETWRSLTKLRPITWSLKLLCPKVVGRYCFPLLTTPIFQRQTNHRHVSVCQLTLASWRCVKYMCNLKKPLYYQKKRSRCPHQMDIFHSTLKKVGKPHLCLW